MAAAPARAQPSTAPSSTAPVAVPLSPMSPPQHPMGAVHLCWGCGIPVHGTTTPPELPATAVPGRTASSCPSHLPSVLPFLSSPLPPLPFPLLHPHQAAAGGGRSSPAPPVGLEIGAAPARYPHPAPSSAVLPPGSALCSPAAAQRHVRGPLCAPLQHHCYTPQQCTPPAPLMPRVAQGAMQPPPPRAVPCRAWGAMQGSPVTAPCELGCDVIQPPLIPCTKGLQCNIPALAAVLCAIPGAMQSRVPPPSQCPARPGVQHNFPA